MNNQTQLLLDIESIKSLKGRYFRSMDLKHWGALAECFTNDLVADFREGPGMFAQGRENYMSQISEILKDASTIHHGHMPEIQVVDEENAAGRGTGRDPRLYATLAEPSGRLLGG